jgi:PAS domain-containing protein
MNLPICQLTKELEELPGGCCRQWRDNAHYSESGRTIQTVQSRQATASRHLAAEALVNSAAEALRDTGPRALKDFDSFPAPLYATDDSGKILYFNPACVEFAGRTPTLNVDRWCVSWKLYACDGQALAHDQCPMAVAIHEKRPVRDVEAFAERPDGERTRFRPFPTPAVDHSGRVVGAVNLLVPVDGHRTLIARADKCRNLAKWVTDKQAEKVLTVMARECERHAETLRLD